MGVAICGGTLGGEGPKTGTCAWFNSDNILQLHNDKLETLIN